MKFNHYSYLFKTTTATYVFHNIAITESKACSDYYAT